MFPDEPLHVFHKNVFKSIVPGVNDRDAFFQRVNAVMMAEIAGDQRVAWAQNAV